MSCGCLLPPYRWRQDLAVVGASIPILNVAAPFQPMAVAVGPMSEYSSYIISPGASINAGEAIVVSHNAPFIGPDLRPQMVVTPIPILQQAGPPARSDLIFYPSVPHVIPSARALAQYSWRTDSITTTETSVNYSDPFAAERGTIVPAHGRSRGLFGYLGNNSDAADTISILLYGYFNRRGYDSGGSGPANRELLQTFTIAPTVTGQLEIYNFASQLADWYELRVSSAAGNISSGNVSAWLDLYD
jgi:hypothetical protein